MPKYINIIISIVFLAYMTGCDKQKTITDTPTPTPATITVSPISLSFEADPTQLTQNISVKASNYWKVEYAEKDKDWVKLSRESGNSEEANISISIKPNNETQRSTILKFTCDDVETNLEITQKAGSTGVIAAYPKNSVTYFEDEFYYPNNTNPYSDKWAFYSSELDGPADQIIGWEFRSSSLSCGVYNGKYTSATNYAIMAPFNVSMTEYKVLHFETLWGVGLNDVLCEVVASTNFAGNVFSADWVVLKDISKSVKPNSGSISMQSIDLSQFDTNDKVYIAFRGIVHQTH